MGRIKKNNLNLDLETVSYGGTAAAFGELDYLMGAQFGLVALGTDERTASDVIKRLDGITRQEQFLLHVALNPSEWDFNDSPRQVQALNRLYQKITDAVPDSALGLAYLVEINDSKVRVPGVIVIGKGEQMFGNYSPFVLVYRDGSPVFAVKGRSPAEVQGRDVSGIHDKVNEMVHPFKDVRRQAHFYGSQTSSQHYPHKITPLADGLGIRA